MSVFVVPASFVFAESNSTNTETVTLEYLERVENTPFAVKKTKDIQVSHFIYDEPRSLFEEDKVTSIRILGHKGEGGPYNEVSDGFSSDFLNYWFSGVLDSDLLRFSSFTKDNYYWRFSYDGDEILTDVSVTFEFDEFYKIDEFYSYGPCVPTFRLIAGTVGSRTEHTQLYGLDCYHVKIIGDTGFTNNYISFSFTFPQDYSGEYEFFLDLKGSHLALDRNEVKEQLGLSSFGVLQSYCDTVPYVKEVNGKKVFKAVYYDTIYLNAKSADGNYCNFYLNCNDSLDDYYHCYVDAGLISQRDLDCFVNSIYCDNAPYLDDYSTDEIYGYWGCVPIPEMRTISNFIASLCSTTSFTFDAINLWTFQHAVSDDCFDKLINEYNYSFFAKYFHFISGFFDTSDANTVYCYMFACDGGEKELLVARNGATSIENSQGALVNTAVDALGNLGIGEGLASILIAGLGLLFVVGIVFLVLKLIRKKKNNKK